MTPTPEGRSAIVSALRRVAIQLRRPDADVGLSVRFPSINDLREHVCELLRRVEGGELDEQTQMALKLLFAPTATLEGVSYGSGWSDEYLMLAARVDAALQGPTGPEDLAT